MEKKMEDVQQPGAPSVIRVKRKRDDAPLDSLYLESSKRRATDHTYVFKRLDQERQVSAIFRQEYGDDGIPKIRTTKEGEEKRDPFALGLVKDIPSPTRQTAKEEVPAGPRRFHLSRAISVGAAAAGKSDVATFVERRVPAQNGAIAAGVSPGTNEQEQDSATNGGQQRAFKRPTARVRANQGSGSAPPKSPNQVDVSMAEKLDQWSQETSQHEAQQDAQEQRGTTAATSDGLVDAMDVDNEADYVYDTYYRQVLTLATEIPDQGISIGHLVIDEDHEDLWETYLDGEDSDDKEFETDDEDSNAEDYYGADYPEDEVASDDEHDRDVYQYRRNADDLEEFDITERDTYEVDNDDDIARSDKEDADEKLSAARAWKRDYGRKVRGEDMVL